MNNHLTRGRHQPHIPDRGTCLPLLIIRSWWTYSADIQHIESSRLWICCTKTIRRRFSLIVISKRYLIYDRKMTRSISVVCRVKRMTSRLKSDRGSSVVHPRSLREVQRVTWSTKFPDEGTERGLSESAGPSDCELRFSLDTLDGVVDPVQERGRPQQLSQLYLL